MRAKIKYRQLFFFLIFLIVSCTDNYKEGIKYFNEKNYDAALSYLREVENVDKNYNLAQIKIAEIDSILKPIKIEKARQDGIAINTNRQETSQLLKYSILNEHIYDIPIKTQILVNVLIEDSTINKENIKRLLEYLYDKTIKRSGFKYHGNPTNIYIYAFTSKDKAKSGMGQWVGMISKGYSENLPSINISNIQLNAINETETNKWNLTYIQRQKIWSKIIHLEDKSEIEADKKYPLDKPGITIEDIKKNGELMESLKEKYERELAKENSIEKAIVDSVKLEGLVNGWAF